MPTLPTFSCKEIFIDIKISTLYQCAILMSQQLVFSSEIKSLQLRQTDASYITHTHTRPSTLCDMMQFNIINVIFVIAEQSNQLCLRRGSQLVPK